MSTFAQKLALVYVKRLLGSLGIVILMGLWNTQLGFGFGFTVG